jgi:hypothetical protein
MQQTDLFQEPKVACDGFTNDDYETPDYEAQMMSNLVLPTDINILEPFAGTGQIVKYLPSDRYIDTIEIKPSRYSRLRENGASFRCCGSFFEWTESEITSYYDLIISNPPFSEIMRAIAHSLTLLNRDNPTARILFLIPLDTFSSKERSKNLKDMDAHIHHTYLLPKRIDYLKDGMPMSKCQKVINGVPQFNSNGKPIMNSGRQCYDAVFDIRPSKEGATTTFLF